MKYKNPLLRNAGERVFVFPIGSRMVPYCVRLQSRNGRWTGLNCAGAPCIRKGSLMQNRMGPNRAELNFP